MASVTINTLWAAAVKMDQCVIKRRMRRNEKRESRPADQRGAIT